MTQYTHIRNATGKLTIKNTTFLIDPFLAPKDTYPGFEGTFNYQQRMPMVDFPVAFRMWVYCVIVISLIKLLSI